MCCCRNNGKLNPGDYKRHYQQSYRCDHSTLLSTSQAVPGIACTFLLPTRQEKHGHIGQGPERVGMMSKGLESLPCKERLEELGLFSLEKAQMGPHQNIPVLKGQIQRGQKLSPHKEQHREDKGHSGSNFTLISSSGMQDSPHC